MNDLKPCPFCGGKARMKHGYPNRQCKSLRQALVQCEVCKCRTVTYKQLPYQAWSDVDKIAEEAWNRRAVDEELKFIREFIHQQGLDYMLEAARKWRKENGK